MLNLHPASTEKYGQQAGFVLCNCHNGLNTKSHCCEVPAFSKLQTSPGFGITFFPPLPSPPPPQKNPKKLIEALYSRDSSDAISVV